jgi:hypothetical protein
MLCCCQCCCIGCQLLLQPTDLSLRVHQVSLQQCNACGSSLLLPLLQPLLVLQLSLQLLLPLLQLLALLLHALHLLQRLLVVWCRQVRLLLWRTAGPSRCCLRSLHRMLLRLAHGLPLLCQSSLCCIQLLQGGLVLLLGSPELPLCCRKLGLYTAERCLLSAPSSTAEAVQRTLPTKVLGNKETRGVGECTACKHSGGEAARLAKRVWP